MKDAKLETQLAKLKLSFQVDGETGDVLPGRAEDREVVCFCKVGTGYTEDELAAICERLRHNTVRFDPKNPPGWMKPNLVDTVRPPDDGNDINDSSVVGGSRKAFKFPAHVRPDIFMTK